MTQDLKKGDFAPPLYGRVFAEVGGCEKRLNEARPVLETFASKILHMGASGNGQLAKALNNCQGLPECQEKQFLLCRVCPCCKI